MTSCIICHTGIDKSTEKAYECPNGHPAHETCLSEWILHAENCPLCSRKYETYIISRCKAYLAKIEEQKEGSLEDRLKKKRMGKIEYVAKNIVFLKNVGIIEELIEKQEFDSAIEKLTTLEGAELAKGYTDTILFLKGKTFFFKGRYDMAIGHLFKLVKERYDFPEAFSFLGKAYQKLGLTEKAKWAFERAQ